MWADRENPAFPKLATDDGRGIHHCPSLSFVVEDFTTKPPEDLIVVEFRYSGRRHYRAIVVTYVKGFNTAAQNLMTFRGELHRYGRGRPSIPHALTADPGNLPGFAEGVIITDLERPAVVGCCEVGPSADSNEAAAAFDKLADLVSSLNSQCGGLFASAPSGKDHDVKMVEGSFEDISATNAPVETSWDRLHNLL